jgi:capsular exopolysaccharide synthesis family protein
MLGDFEINDILKTPGLDNLHIITSGTRPPNPSEILSSDRFRKFLKEAVQEYDYVFVDAPPILPVADATEIAPVVDGVVLVYTIGKIARGVLKRAKSSLDNIDAKVMGVILNNVKPEVGPDYFKYHSQHYYGYENGKQDKLHGGSLRKLSLSSGTGRTFSFIALTVAVALMLLGIFWPDLWQSMMSL